MNLKTFHRNDEVIYVMSLITSSLNYVDYYYITSTGEKRLGFAFGSGGFLSFGGRYEDMVDFFTIVTVLDQNSSFFISCRDDRLGVIL